MYVKAVVYLGAVLIFYVISDIEALDSHGEGVCVVKLSMPQIRRKSFSVQLNKWCGRRKCIVRRYKTESYLTWTNQTVCCNGWQHNSDLDVCSPICSTGCRGGRCVGPDLCRCDPPSYLDPQLQNTCITPICRPDCVNAICHANNTCICKENFNRYNSTHCFHCDLGYTIDETLKCSPVCEHRCVNGFCSAPNICECFDGYKSRNNSICEPICDCVNGVCVSPDTCSCFEGYVPVNNTVCVPKCYNCSNGYCMSPNVCSCHDGYESVDGVCKPKCAMCENGVCSVPGVCTCDDGYVNNGTRCVILCDRSCDGYCQDGLCVKRNCSSTPIRSFGQSGSTTSERVECCNGWTYIRNTDKCKPICTKGCRNGRCIGVNECICNPPYVKLYNKCVLPKCDKQCVNSVCTLQNQCTCKRGYKKINDTTCVPECTSCDNEKCVPENCLCKEGYVKVNGICQPICNSGCTNGICEAPNQCTCNSGYKKINDTTCVPECTSCDKEKCIPENCVCKEGYVKVNGICQPICNSGCTNGICQAPNQCTCNRGYKKINDTTCVPECTSCDKEKCIPENCVCKEGYAKIKGICQPICISGCTNGICQAPNQCTCNRGYKKINDTTCVPECTSCDKEKCIPENCVCKERYAKITGICQPICISGCTNGICQAPNQCTCNRGYKKINDTTCVPECTSCDKEKCIPENCVCKEGYVKVNGICQPICNSGCTNGICQAPNQCTCNRGYKKINDTTCVPECTSCDNEKCVPENCLCKEGYVKVNGICQPICNSGCTNGVCKAPNQCTCNRGYKKINDTTGVPECTSCDKEKCIPENCVCKEGYAKIKGICQPICISGCTNGICQAPNQCTCNRGYKKINDTTCVPECTSCDKEKCIPENCVCKERYAKIKGICQPICISGCTNGICQAPNQCTCNRGYKKINDTTCVPECTSCDNEKCVPENCLCKEGYVKVNGICQPICNSGCTNGVCKAPNQCTCNRGYKKINDTTCIPSCQNKCINAICIRPDQCECEPGYKPTVKSWLCEPVCDHCNKGVCTAPNKCTCPGEYNLETSIGCIATKPIDCANCSRCAYDDDTYCCENSIPIAPCLHPYIEIPEEITGLAGLELSWTLGGVVGLLMLLVVGIVMQRMWHNRKEYYDAKRLENGISKGSVVFTLPHTLLQSRMLHEHENDVESATGDSQNSLPLDPLLEETCQDDDSVDIRL